MISCGAFAPLSRLARLIWVLLVVVTAMPTTPFPWTSGVISIETQVPSANPPDDPVMDVDIAGALEYVTAISSQAVSATFRMLIPVDDPLLAKIRKVALVTGPGNPWTLNLI